MSRGRDEWDAGARGATGDERASYGPAAAGKRTRTQRIARRASGEAEAPTETPAAPAAPAGAEASADPFGLHLLSSSGGAPLPDAVRERFEGSLHTDLSDVRVHTGEASAGAARRLGALAFATGDDVHFAPGQYDPGSERGLQLLAHEVAHTVQQRGAGGAPQTKRVSEPGDASEVQADAAAESMVAGRPFTLAAGSAPAAISRWADDRTAATIVSLIDTADRAGLQHIMLGLEHARANHGEGAGLTPLRVEGLWEGAVDGRDLRGLEARTRARFGALPATAPTPTAPTAAGPTAPPSAPAPASTPTPIRQGNEPLEPLDPGPDYQAMPTYIDNYVSGEYNVLTDVLELVYADGVVLPIFLADLHAHRNEPSTAPPSGGGIRITLYVYSRDTHGRIRPSAYDQQTAPNLMGTMAAIARARPEVERRVAGTLADGLPMFLVSWGSGGGTVLFRRRGARGATEAVDAPTTQGAHADPPTGPTATSAAHPNPPTATSAAHPNPPTATSAAHPNPPTAPSTPTTAAHPSPATAPAPSSGRSGAHTEPASQGAPSSGQPPRASSPGGPDETMADLQGARPPYGAPPPPARRPRPELPGGRQWRDVPRGSLHGEGQETNAGWSYELRARVDDTDVVIATATVDSQGVVHNPDLATDHLVGGRPVRVAGDGFSLTEELNLRIAESYRSRRPGETINREITGYSAGFQQTNQTAFNRAYDLAQARGLAQQDAAIVAAAATPSGWVTVQQGFGDISVTLQPATQGASMRRANATMRRGPFPPALRPHLDAVRAQMR